MKKFFVTILSLTCFLVAALGECMGGEGSREAALQKEASGSGGGYPASAGAGAAFRAVADGPRSGRRAAGLECPEGHPSRGGQLIKHLGFTVEYDADFKTPLWVAWELTADETLGDAKRESRFEPDPDVRGAKALHEDYTRSGYDRGHMAPAADMKWCEQAMEESFYTSNICPQNPNLNRGDWKDLEELTRDFAIRYGSVCTCAGPIYRSKSPIRIGRNRVAVPDAFFKVLLVGFPDAPKAYGFIFNNAAGSRPLSAYQLSVDEVERKTGMDFFPLLPDEVEEEVEACIPAL